MVFGCLKIIDIPVFRLFLFGDEIENRCTRLQNEAPRLPIYEYFGINTLGCLPERMSPSGFYRRAGFLNLQK
jgi:hypothetical protein